MGPHVHDRTGSVRENDRPIVSPVTVNTGLTPRLAVRVTRLPVHEANSGPALLGAEWLALGKVELPRTAITHALFYFTAQFL